MPEESDKSFIDSIFPLHEEDTSIEVSNAGTCVDCDREVVLNSNGYCSICGSNSVVKRGAIRELEVLLKQKEEEKDLSPKGIVHTCLTDLDTALDSLRFAYETNDELEMIYHLKKASSQIDFVKGKVNNLIQEMKNEKESNGETGKDSRPDKEENEPSPDGKEDR